MTPDDAPDTKLHRWLGAHIVAEQKVRFCVWSPNHQEITLHLVDSNRHLKMTQSPGGYHRVTADDVGVGQRYIYHVDGGPGRPDPASRFQPQGVHGASQIVDPTFAWTDHDWSGVERNDLVIEELHIGAFTAQGTFAAAIARLDELVDLGVTAIELMPVATAPGKWNWGYDGVNLFAPSPNYGTPNDLRRLIDAAHAKGLAVILDVVYNHLGPEGNYLADFGPYFSSRHHTPWGAAPNFDDPDYGRQLRRFFVANAIHWFDEYHFDGLRVDAIHCMRDDSEPHVAAQISEAVKTWSSETNRPAMLIAESNVYDSNMLEPRSRGGIGFDAQWCDDLLHSVFAVVRPGEDRCHREYKPDDLPQTLEYGFVYEGSLREQRGRCTPSQRVDTSGLVYAIQHHDFVGNHPQGKRLHQLAGKQTQRAAAALLLLSPAIPMLFMGEEFACEHPFRFFVDFGNEQLRQAVVEGRKSEYPQHDWGGGGLPTDPSTFEESKIGSASDGDSSMRAWYRELIRLRKTWRKRGLICDANLSVQADGELGLYVCQYADAEHALVVAVRLNPNSADSRPIPFGDPGDLLLDSRTDQTDNVLFPNHAKVFTKKFDTSR